MCVTSFPEHLFQVPEACSHASLLSLPLSGNTFFCRCKFLLQFFVFLKAYVFVFRCAQFTYSVIYIHCPWSPHSTIVTRKKALHRAYSLELPPPCPSHHNNKSQKTYHLFNFKFFLASLFNTNVRHYVEAKRHSGLESTPHGSSPL